MTWKTLILTHSQAILTTREKSFSLSLAHSHRFSRQSHDSHFPVSQSLTPRPPLGGRWD